MAITFDYRLQIEAQAKTALGRDMTFLMERKFTNVVEETSYDEKTAAVVNTDVNGDFVYESMDEMLEKDLTEYCLRHGLVKSSVSILTYTVSTDEQDVVVFFDRVMPKKRTTNKSDEIYAYIQSDIGVPAAPEEVTARSTDEGMALSWLTVGHHHGIRIYNEYQELIASLGENTVEWLDRKAPEGRRTSYYVSCYHRGGESERVKVTGFFESKEEANEEETANNWYRKWIERETGKIAVFQSGIGDLDDLKVVKKKKGTGEEYFKYTSQLRGVVERRVNVYPRREFQYRIVAHNPYGIEFATTPWRVGIIDGKGALTEEGAGKEDLRTSLDIEVDTDGYVEYTVEMVDPSGHIEIKMDKGVSPSTTYIDDMVTFSSKESSKEERDVRTSYYGQKKVHEETRMVKIGEELLWEEDLEGPWSQEVFRGKTITEWTMLLQSDNPNVRIEVAHPADDYAAERNMLQFGLKAVVVNEAQSPWSPLLTPGYYYMNQSERYLFNKTEVKGLPIHDYKIVADDNNEVIVSPKPVGKGPIIVKDVTGEAMQQVFFYDEDGNITLDYEEEIVSSKNNELALSYLDVDYETLRLSYVNADGEESNDVYYFIQDNLVHIYTSLKPGTVITARYRLNRSFGVDTKYGGENQIRILLHGALLDGSREVKVYYETEAEKKKVDKIDLNPLKNTQNSGFLYISDEVEMCKEIELEADKQTLYATGRDVTFIRAIARDRFGNPVVGERIHMYAERGTLSMKSDVSDENGMVVGRYRTPASAGKDKVTAMSSMSGIVTTTWLEIKEQTTGSHISLSTSHPVVYPGWNEIVVKAYVYGENQEPLRNMAVKFEFDSGMANKQTARTNQFGVATIVFAANEIPRTGIIRIRATVEEIGAYEETLVRILGFRYYDPNYFMRGNNLIDIYDRVVARENLGISAQTLAPQNPQEFDLWVDQGDMLFLQTSYQLRDLVDKEASRENLGISKGVEAPEGPWMNDIWIEE